MPSDEKRESALAASFRARGLALFRPLARQRRLANTDRIEMAVLQLMRAFAASESDPRTAGSVCVSFEQFTAAGDGTLTAEEAFEWLLKKADDGSAGMAREMEEAAFAPFVIDRPGKRIYFDRRFADEKHLAEAAALFAKQEVSSVTPAARRALDAFALDDRKTGWTDAEHDRAVESALEHRLSVITGGPGTGKTTVVVRILAALLADNPDLVIAGAAPTGKAASNLYEAVAEAARRMKSGDSEELRQLGERVEKADLRCQTLHRWLQEKNPSDGKIHADVLVADECSMMEIDLAVQVFAALDPERTRLILLGDKNQLSAVGPGSVFADFSDRSGALSPLISEFTRSHRFSEKSKVGRLSSAMKAGDARAADAAVAELQKKEVRSDDNRIEWIAAGREKDGLTRELRRWLTGSEGYGSYLEALSSVPEAPEAGEPESEAVRTFWEKANDTRVISAMHSGCNGTDAVNAFMEELVRERTGAAQTERHFPGRLILVQKNAASLGLSNGDTAVELPQMKNGRRRLIAWFGNLKFGIPAELLPEHTSAFAITIHKSQGSSYHRLAVAVPDAEESGGLFSRELLYTAVTRVADRGGKKGTLSLFASEKAVRDSVLHGTERTGGLADRLRTEVNVLGF